MLALKHRAIRTHPRVTLKPFQLTKSLQNSKLVRKNLVQFKKIVEVRTILEHGSAVRFRGLTGSSSSSSMDEYEGETPAARDHFRSHDKLMRELTLSEDADEAEVEQEMPPSYSTLKTPPKRKPSSVKSASKTHSQEKMEVDSEHDAGKLFLLFRLFNSCMTQN
jgi:hypothetical protein